MSQRLKCAKFKTCVAGRDSALNPAGRAYSTPHTPQLDFLKQKRRKSDARGCAVIKIFLK